MEKLIFCFDGTGNEPEDVKDRCDDEGLSNIAKLHILFGGRFGETTNEDQKTGQKSFYYSGVGTRGSILRRIINQTVAPKNMGVAKILNFAKKDLKSEEKMAEVYVFGFSRGAALARRFAAIIERPVKLLGVFDTVASMGIPELDPDTRPSADVLFEYGGTVAEKVENAVHLVSLDERRVCFQPTLFNYEQDIVNEVWFSGAHSDVGGGFWSDGLSDITLQFMCDKAKEAGITVSHPDEIEFPIKIGSKKDCNIVKDDVEIKPLFDGPSHEQIRSRYFAAVTLAPRLLCVNVNNERSTDSDHIPIIHHTVFERFKRVTNYRPFILKGKKFKIMDVNKNIGDTIHGISGLRDI